MTSISILDPTTLLGREIAEHVAAAFPGVQRRYFHTADTEEHLILELAEAPALVPPLTSCDELHGSAAVVVPQGIPDRMALELLSWLNGNPDVALVDVSQPGIAGDVAVTVLDGAAPGAGPRWLHLADPGLFGPVRLVRALGPLGPEALRLTMLRPVSDRGEEGMQELAAQGAARLSGASPGSPRHLPAVLAFDLHPSGAGVRASLERQLAALLPGMPCTVQPVDAGVFHGHAAAAMVAVGETATETALKNLVRKVPGMRPARASDGLHPSDIAGKDEVLCSELRITGTEVAAWLLADGLRVGGAQAVVSVLTDLGVLSA